MELKITDWDAAHFTDEPLLAKTQERLCGRREAVAYHVALNLNKTVPQPTERLKLYDTSLMHVLNMYKDEPTLRSRQKLDLDEQRHTTKVYSVPSYVGDNLTFQLTNIIKDKRCGAGGPA